jgi:uncharacterized RDD family membrane protein YckC
MQCSSCRVVYSNGLSLCPRCKTPAPKPVAEAEIIETEIETVAAISESTPTSISIEAAMTNDSSPIVTASTSSTLIEFPGTSRASRPQWRKDLSARVREIQERRAREAEEAPPRQIEQLTEMETAAPQLGLVPTPDAPEVNPIVAAALKRLERARQPSLPMPRPRSSMGGAAAAIARVVDEQYETESSPALAQASMPDQMSVPSQSIQTGISPSLKSAEPAREHQLAIVPAQPAPKIAASAIKPQAKRIVTDVVDEAPLALSDEEASGELPAEEFYDDRAPVLSRIAGSLLDFLAVAFASSPFAAIIELTNGNWTDWRVIASMSGIFLVVMFLYLTASTALIGRTWGMSRVSLHAVDAETGRPPTTKQSVGRAILYIVSLLSFGLGILYALFDAEGRAVHDLLSGTVVVRD